MLACAETTLDERCAALSYGKQRVELRCADKVVFRQPVDRMSRVVDRALAVADGHVGMVVLAMRYPGRRVDERHRLVIILEFVGFGNDAVAQLPAVELAEQGSDFRRLQR